MVNFCAVVGCSNRSNRDDKSFFRLPIVIIHQGEKTQALTEQRRREWLSSINRSDLGKHVRVCSDHFINGKPATLYDTTNPDWVPTIQLGHKKVPQSRTVTERYNRLQARKRKREEGAVLQEIPVQDLHQEFNVDVVCDNENVQPNAQVYPPLNNACESCTQTECFTSNCDTSTQTECFTSNCDASIQTECFTSNCDASIQTECFTSNCDANTQTDVLGSDIDVLNDDMLQRSSEIHNLKERLHNATMTPESFSNDDKKCNFFTGLQSFTLMMQIFRFIAPYLSEKRMLDPFQQFLLFSMRLRMNFNFEYLGYKFNVGTATACRIFHSWLDASFTRLQFLVFWPAKESLQKTMPMCFRKNFGLRIAVILDCFEVFIERPMNLLARCQTWSQYKHHNTVKLLIAVSPQGVITFISKAYGGRCSDKFIAENCGMLENLTPGDVVLADRGFNISETVGLYCAELHMPAFTKGKSQLSAWDIERTRKIGNVRIHVERVIGVLRNRYTILQSVLPVSYLSKDSTGLTTVDKLVFVCSAFINCAESIVSFQE